MYLMNMYQDKGIPYLVKEREYPEIKANSPEDVSWALEKIFNVSKLPEEHIWLINETTAGNIISVMEISHGTVNSSIVNPREIMQRALLSGAAGIIIAHNHPSGNCSPSTADMDVKDRLKEAGNLLGVPLIDFIIVANGNRYMSFQEEGAM